MKRNMILYIVIFFFIAYAGYVAFETGKKNRDGKKQAEKKITQAFPALCEAGKWIEISKENPPGEKYAESVVLKKTGNKFSNTEDSIFFTASERERLDFFADREIKVEGVRKSEKEVAVGRIKCIGIEADQKDLAERRKLMKYIALNIDTLAPEKNKNGAWQAEGFHFVNETDLYVEYGLAAATSVDDKKKNSEKEDALEAGEAVAERKSWLIRATKLERPKPVIEELAYLKNSGAENIQEGTVLRGENIHQKSKITQTYKLDKATNQWKLQ